MSAEGTVILRFASDPDRTIDYAVARPGPVEMDVDLRRAPYGTRWFKVGTGLREAERLLLSLEIFDDAGIGAAGVAASSVVEDVLRAQDIETPFATFYGTTMESMTRSPIENGWRLEFEMISVDGVVLQPLVDANVVTWEVDEVVTYEDEPVIW